MNEKLESQIEVRPNCTVHVTYTHTGPTRNPPDSGSEWPDLYDHPEVRVDLALTPCGRSPAPYLYGARVFGVVLDASRDSLRTTYRTAPTVREAYEMCRAEVDAAVESIGQVIDLRNARNQQRCETIAKSRVGSPFHHVD